MERTPMDESEHNWVIFRALLDNQIPSMEV
jgi:hypothetical protein